jgi:CRP-like cAMP-binding protein
MTDIQPLLHKMRTIFDLSPEEEGAVLSLPVTIRVLKAGQDIVRDQDRPSQCCAILDGFAFRYKIMEGGKRQILSFHIPGDIPDLQSLHLEIMDHSLATLVRSTVAFIPHDAVRGLVHAYPRIADAFWRDTLIDAAIFREWVANIGRRPAYARLAHVLCELFARARAVGLADGHAFELPLTQEELGDAMGLSTVHVNRMMTELRGAGLIDTPKGTVVIKDWTGLQQAGEFDATYLHIQRSA